MVTEMAAQFNRTPFNRRSGGRVYQETYIMAQTLRIGAGAGASIRPQYSLSTALRFSAELGWGYGENYRMAQSMQMKASMPARIAPVYRLAAELQMTAAPLCQTAYRAAQSMEMGAAGRIVIMPDYGLQYANLDVVIDGTQYKTTVMRFPTLKIPAGGQLVIDSDFFTTTLDGENVLDQYEGDWLQFTRELASLSAQSGGSGSLKVSVLYRERYL